MQKYEPNKTFWKPIQLNKTQLDNWMKRLIAKAEKIGALGEIPVCAVVLNNEGHCIGYGSNTRVRRKDPLGHAELIALKQASLIRGDWRLNDCTLLVTLEPCPMCAGALIQARIGQVIFGASDPKRGALGGTLDLSNQKSSHHNMLVQGGVMEKKAREQLQSWFKEHRFRKFKT